eukprot:m.12583 g.12583  ORF g.12583 m.12583 type:complete len:92 (+) comp5836_c0_seq1:1687-1962(+)
MYNTQFVHCISQNRIRFTKQHKKIYICHQRSINDQFLAPSLCVVFVLHCYNTPHPASFKAFVFVFQPFLFLIDMHRSFSISVDAHQLSNNG